MDTMKKIMNRLHGYRHKAKECKCYDKKTSSKYCKILKEYYKKNKDNMSLSSRDKKQISLFCTSFKLYCVAKDIYN